MTNEQAQSAVLHAIPILATPDLDEADAKARLKAQGHSVALATQLWVLVPEALARPVLKELGMVAFASHFDVQNRHGETVQVPTAQVPVFVAALALGERVFAFGYREPLTKAAYQTIDGRSASLDAANRMLNGGGSLQGASEQSLSLLGLLHEDLWLEEAAESQKTRT